MTKIEELAIEYYKADRSLHSIIRETPNEEHKNRLTRAFDAKKALFKEIESSITKGGDMLDSWRCNICDSIRTDDKINVFIRPLIVNGNEIGSENIRYCNDNPDCREKAKTFTFLKSIK